MNFDFHVVMPVLIVAAYGLLVLVFTPAFPRKDVRLLAAASLVGLAVAAFKVVRLHGYKAETAGGLVLTDDFALFFDLLFLVAGAIAILASSSYLERENACHGEYYALILFSIAGMMTMVGSENLLMIFLGLELLSIPLYILSGFLRDRHTPIEISGAICRAPWTTLAVYPNGDVFPCMAWSRPPAGNFRTQSFEEIWNGAAMTALRAEFQEVRPGVDCLHCTIRRDGDDSEDDFFFRKLAAATS